MTRCSTSTNPVPNGVSEDCGNITCGASCQAACAVGPKSANHTESNSVPPYSVCEEKKCVDVATSDSSRLTPDCVDLTSGDLCKVMHAAGYNGGASTLTRTLDVVSGSVSFIGSLPNCPAAWCAVDDIPSGMIHDCDGIAFLGSCYANCSDGYAPVDVTSSTCLVAPKAFLSGTLRHLIPLAKPCLARAARSSTTTPWRAWTAF